MEPIQSNHNCFPGAHAHKVIQLPVLLPGYVPYWICTVMSLWLAPPTSPPSPPQCTTLCVDLWHFLIAFLLSGLQAIERRLKVSNHRRPCNPMNDHWAELETRLSAFAISIYTYTDMEVEVGYMLFLHAHLKIHFPFLIFDDQHLSVPHILKYRHQNQNSRPV